MSFKRSKNLVALILSILMLALFIPALAEEDVTLTFNYWGDGLEVQVVEETLRRFTEETGIKVETLHIPRSAETATKLTAMAAAGTLPDCGYIPEILCIAWGQEGMLTTLSQLEDTSVIDSRLDITYYTDGENVYGASGACESYLLYYNKAIFDEAGIAYPPKNWEEAWTWDEFIDVSRQLTKDTKGNHPGEDGFDAKNVFTYGAYIPKWASIVEAFMRSNGGGTYNADYSELILDDPANLEAIQALADLANVEFVHPTPANEANVASLTASFLSGKVAMAVDGQWSIQALVEAQEEDGLEWGIGVLPMMKQPVTINEGGGLGVYNTSKHPEEAIQLVKYLFDTEFVLDLVNCGLWMPSEAAWFTDEELISRWVVEGVHPAEYREAAIDYTLNCSVPANTLRVRNASAVQDIYMPALDQVWNGSMTAGEAIAGIIDSAQAAFVAR